MVDVSPRKRHDLEIGPVRTGSGLYVDIENIQNSQELIEAAIDTWPDRFPKPTRLCLHVRADQVDLWQLWATSKFERLEVTVAGIQKFSGSKSKNTADIAIATSALADWIFGMVSHVAVLSDDSDFIGLYSTMRREIARSQLDWRDEHRIRAPFLWVMTARDSTRSQTAMEFFPDEHVHIVQINETTTVTPAAADDPAFKNQHEPAAKIGTDVYMDMALEIVRQTPEGNFKSTDCMQLIKRGWRNHSLANTDGATFGTEFKKKIWPALETMGVEITGRNPVKYKMTQAAKRKSSRLT